MSEITITLPIPATSISPNGKRGHSRIAALARSREVKKHRQWAKIAVLVAIANGQKATSKTLGYSLRHYFPTMNFRDCDNADGACKAYQDGICDALGINDRHFEKIKLSTREKDAKNPRVEITIYFES